MEIEAVIVRVYNDLDRKRLLRAGGEVIQEEAITRKGQPYWQARLIRLPLAAALRMGLIRYGPESSPPRAA